MMLKLILDVSLLIPLFFETSFSEKNGVLKIFSNFKLKKRLRNENLGRLFTFKQLKNLNQILIPIMAQSLTLKVIHLYLSVM